MQWCESLAGLWLYCFHTPQRSCATAPGGEEIEEEEKDEMRKMSWTFFYALARLRVKERVYTNI